MSLSGQYKRILTGEMVDIYTLIMSTRFKSERLFIMIVFEGVVGGYARDQWWGHTFINKIYLDEIESDMYATYAPYINL